MWKSTPEKSSVAKTNTMVYTGIGSRSTPLDVITLLIQMGRTLADRGYTLRSGGADGADAAFETGCDLVRGKKEIFLPWQGFNNSLSPLWGDIPAKAFDLAASVHPNWKACNQAAKKLHSRNAQQILGINLDSPSDFVICWTPDGTVGGGTATAIRIAQMHHVPVINFGVAFRV